MRAGSLLAPLQLGSELLRHRRYLFVMSHMRSYSSLLCHILNSHPAVSGYVELHRAYQTRRDLLTLPREIRRTVGTAAGGRILVDKLLHNYADVSPSILERDDVSTVFIVREPVRTIRSTIAMARRNEKPGWKGKPRKVGKYYVARLERLCSIARSKPTGSLFFDADLIVSDTQTVLAALEAFLGLSEPLREDYATFERTGAPRFGDPSPYIGTGHVVRERDSYDDIAIPDDVLETTSAAYREAAAQLSRSVETSIP